LTGEDRLQVQSVTPMSKCHPERAVALPASRGAMPWTCHPEERSDEGSAFEPLAFRLRVPQSGAARLGEIRIHAIRKSIRILLCRPVLLSHTRHMNGCSRTYRRTSRCRPHCEPTLAKPARAGHPHLELMSVCVGHPPRQIEKGAFKNDPTAGNTFHDYPPERV
jgi:hypothetical protein